jgi:hypothetical protein
MSSSICMPRTMSLKTVTVPTSTTWASNMMTLDFKLVTALLTPEYLPVQGRIPPEMVMAPGDAGSKSIHSFRLVRMVRVTARSAFKVLILS